MRIFLLQPEAIPALVMMILAGLMMLYLTISVKEKDKATWWLITALGGLFLTWVYFWLSNSLAPDVHRSRMIMRSMVLFLLSGLALFSWAFLMFSYHFLENTFSKESKVSGIITGAVLFGILSTIFYNLFANNLFFINSFLLPVFALLILGYCGYGILIFLRKKHAASKQDKKREALAYRNFALVYGLIFLFVVQVSYRFATSNYPALMEFTVIVTSLIFIFGLAITYLNYSNKAISFQVKLVGYTLVTVLSVFALNSILFFSDSTANFTENSGSKETIQLIPSDNGSFQVITEEARFDSSGLGTNLDLGDDAAKKVVLPFDFPFADSLWNEVFVSPNGAVSFGNPVYGKNLSLFSPSYLYNEVPKLFPFYQDFNPTLNGKVLFDADSAKVIITWYKLAPFGREAEKNSFQVVLKKEGNIVFNYGEIHSQRSPQVNSYGYYGLVAGGAGPNLVSSESATSIPKQLAKGESWVQTIGIDQQLAIHSSVFNFVWMLFGFAVFVLLFSPYFFKNSLINPLDRLLNGVQRVNEGDLTIKIPIEVEDEIGSLTRNFNRMAQSLHEYHSEMDELVAKRTQELEAAYSDLQKSHEELKKTQKQLVQQEKLASLGQLTAGIAHEIKNPLNFVNNFSDLSVELVEEAREELSASSRQISNDADKTSYREDGIEPDDVEVGDVPTVEEALAILDDIEANLKKINEHGSRADSIVKSMLQHSRGGDGEMELTDLNALIEEYVNLSFHGMRAGENPINVDIELELDENVGEIPLIGEDFSRVIVNLCNNAFDAMREKEKTVGSGQEAVKYVPKLTVRTIRDDGQVTIEIEDNGPGIPEEMKDKILQPFFTTKQGTEGTGLGLSITNDIVKAHGGEIKIESEPGNLTVFKILLNSKMKGN